jgi:pimeloyl-ACP methyl ester carboxylesterase
MRFAFLLLAASVGTAFADEGLRFHFSATPGPYAVGFKVIEQYDRSRTWRLATDALGKPTQGERTRPLQTLVWYPARENAGRRMRVSDYAQFLATETTFGHPLMSAKDEGFLQEIGPSLNEPLRAVRDAPAAQGRFHVAIYAPGAADMAWENADLCEYLASFGYVMIAGPSLGPTIHPMTIDVAGAEAQADDISFLIGYAQTLPNADAAAVAVIGHSWGAMASLLAAARDSRIAALVALDGSTRYYPGFLKLADLHPDIMTLPLLFFIQGDYSLELKDRYADPLLGNGPNVLNAWTHGDLIAVHLLGVPHAAMTSAWQRNEDYWSELTDSAFMPGDYGREDAIAGYGWMARYTRKFLDAYLNHDASAVEFLKNRPAANAVPQHVMSVIYRSAAGPPASFEAYRAELGRLGFEHAAEVYTAFRKEKPDFTLDEAITLDWANDLVDGGHAPQAVLLLRLILQIHPESNGAYLSLGDAYVKTGQKQLAIESYQHALTQSRSVQLLIRRKLAALEQGQ